MTCTKKWKQNLCDVQFNVSSSVAMLLDTVADRHMFQSNLKCLQNSLLCACKITHHLYRKGRWNFLKSGSDDRCWWLYANTYYTMLLKWLLCQQSCFGGCSTVMPTLALEHLPSPIVFETHSTAPYSPSGLFVTRINLLTVFPHCCSSVLWCLAGTQCN